MVRLKHTFKFVLTCYRCLPTVELWFSPKWSVPRMSSFSFTSLCLDGWNEAPHGLLEGNGAWLYFNRLTLHWHFISTDDSASFDLLRLSSLRLFCLRLSSSFNLVCFCHSWMYRHSKVNSPWVSLTKAWALLHGKQLVGTINLAVNLSFKLVTGNALSLVTGIIAAGLYGNIGISLVPIKTLLASALLMKWSQRLYILISLRDFLVAHPWCLRRVELFGRVSCLSDEEKKLRNLTTSIQPWSSHIGPLVGFSLEKPFKFSSQFQPLW